MEHPGAASVPCAECQKWLYDLETGQKLLRGGLPQARKQKPPCETCPKQSPERAKEIELSPKNLATLRLYLKNRAMHGGALTEAEQSDPIVQSNFLQIDLLMRRWETQQAGTSIQAALSAAIGVKR